MLTTAPHHRSFRSFRAVTIYIVFALVLAAAESSAGAQAVKVRFQVTPTPRRTCGAESLYFCLTFSGRDKITLAEAVKKLPAGYRGVSAADIVRLCASLDVPVHAMRTTFAELNSLETPSILHVNDEHFISFVRLEGDRVLLFDNTIGLLDCSQEWFKQQYQWHGDALVLRSRSALVLSFLQTKRFLFLTAGLFAIICGLYLLPARGRITTRERAGAA